VLNGIPINVWVPHWKRVIITSFVPSYISTMRVNIVAYRPLLSKDLETNNETTAVAMQHRVKHASTIIELLLETVLGSCNSCTTAVETGVFSMLSVPRSYLEDSWGDPVTIQMYVQLDKENPGTGNIRGLNLAADKPTPVQVS
jgi:hypothetical protein